MHDMFHLAMPWWQLAVRAAIVYVVLLLLIRLSGKHTMGELSIFDLIVVIVLGSAVRSALVGDDKSVPGALIVVAVLLLLDFVSSAVASRSLRGDRLLEGRPVLLARDGVLFEEVLKRSHVPQSRFLTTMRRHGVTSMEMVEQAILEPSGAITLKKRDTGAEPPSRPGD